MTISAERETARQISAGAPRQPSASALDRLAHDLAPHVSCRRGPPCQGTGDGPIECTMCREDAYTLAQAAIASLTEIIEGELHSEAQAVQSAVSLVLLRVFLSRPPSGPACPVCGHLVIQDGRGWWHLNDDTPACQPPDDDSASGIPGDLP